jgi:hypothetical protein
MPIFCKVQSVDGAFEAEEKPSAVEPLYLVCVTRYPAELRNDLVNGSLLAPYRDALSAAGHNFETASGAKIFCAANQYDFVRSCMQSMDVRPYHIVVSATCRELVVETIARLPKSLKVRIKDEKIYAMVPVGKLFAKPLSATGKSLSFNGSEKFAASAITDSTSEGSSGLEESIASGSMEQSSFPIAPDMDIPFSLYSDLFWASSALFDWAQFHNTLADMAPELAPDFANQTFPVEPKDQLEWQMASHREILEGWDYVPQKA